MIGMTLASIPLSGGPHGTPCNAYIPLAMDIPGLSECI